MRRIRELELVVGAGFLLGPLVYALTLRPAEPTVVEVEVVKVVEVTKVVEVVKAAEPAPTFEPKPFMFVSGNTVILDTQASTDWARGELFEPVGEVSHRAARPADLERLPAGIATRVQQPIDLYGPEGKLCTVAIERLTVVAQYDGWSVNGMYEDAGELEQEVEYDDEGWPIGVTPAERRNKLWDTQPKWLIGELAIDPSCEGASWARDTALPAPMILTESERSNATGRARLRAFRRSSALTELRAEYEAFLAELDPESLAVFDDWDRIAKEDPARASVWLDGAGEAQVVELRFGPQPGGGCGDFDVYRTRLEVRRGATFETSEWSVDPIAVFDADLDGQFELLYDIQADGWARTLRSSSPSLAMEAEVYADFICPC